MRELRDIDRFGFRWRYGRFREHAGFSVVEMLVSVTIVLLLLTFLGQVLNFASNSWRHGESNKERLQNARAINYYIAKELKAALLPVNRTSTSSIQLVVNPSGIDAQIYNNSSSIFWQAPLATDRSLGDVAEIGYFVRWDNATDPQRPRSQLYRFLVNPSDQQNYLIYSNPSRWITDSIIQAIAPGTRSSGYQGLLAENVIGFWVKCLDSAGVPISRNYAGSPFTGSAFDTRQGYTDSTGAKQSPCALPPCIELSLVLLDTYHSQKIDVSRQPLIQSLTKTANDASEFINQATANPNLIPIKAGWRSCQTRVYLQNSR